LTLLQREGLGAAFGSAALLAGAYFFQYGLGLAPCVLCLWQRWPHWIAVAIGLVLIALPARGLALMGALAMATGAGIAAYHVGVEHLWWPGPNTCAAPDLAGQSAGELLESILAAPVVRCEDVAWSLFGISMAGWNALASVVLAGLWLRAYASSSASQ
jgi:disulfide bond formation protein DsbB